LEATYLNTFALWQTDPWLLLTDDEDVAFSRSEGVVNGVLDVYNVEATIVSLTVSDDTNSAHVTTTSDHGDHTGVKSDEVSDLASCEVNLDCVVDLDSWIWVSDSTHPSAFVVSRLSNQTLIQRLIDGSRDLRACIMRDQEWDSSSTKLYSLDLSELVFCLSCLNSVNSKSAFSIVDEAEVLASLLNRDHIHEAGWVGGICSHFAIDLDESLHNNLRDFSAIESILQAVSEEYYKRQAVSLFVRAGTAHTPLACYRVSNFAVVATHDGFGA